MDYYYYFQLIYFQAMVTLFGALGYGISLLQVGKGTFQTMAASDGRYLG